MVQGQTKGLSKGKSSNAATRHAQKAAAAPKKGKRFVAPKKAAAVKQAALHKVSLSICRGPFGDSRIPGGGEAAPRRFPPPPRPFSAEARRWTLAKGQSGRGTGGRASEGTRVRATRRSARELSSVLVLESRVWNTGRARG